MPYLENKMRKVLLWKNLFYITKQQTKKKTEKENKRKEKNTF